RRQAVARAVRDPYPQAPARHPRADAADPRRTHEARPVRWRGRRDQVLRSTAVAKVDLFNVSHQKVGDIELADAVFGIAEINKDLFYEVVKAQLASRRSGTAAAKGRSAVSGSKRKLYRQK